MSPNPAKTPDNAQSTATLADIAAVQGQGQDPKDTKDQTKEAPKGKVKTAYVRSKVGPMRHLHTNEELTAHEKRIELDAFTQAQIDAGKWETVKPET